jgi:diguanylate cyclase (GGDEF)-like protein/PAS domain S-box-containing protein
MLTQQRLYTAAPGWLLTALAMPLLWWTTIQHATPDLSHHYASVTHTLVEFGSLLASLLIFSTSYRAAKAPRQRGLFLLALGFGGGGLLDFYRVVSEFQGNTGPHFGSGQTAQLLWLLARLMVQAGVLAYVLTPPERHPDPWPNHWLRPVTAGVAWLLLASTLGFGLTWPLQTLHAHWSAWMEQVLAVLIGASSLATLATLWLQGRAHDKSSSEELRTWGVLTFLASLFCLLPEDSSGSFSDLLGDAYRVCAYIYLYQYLCRECATLPQRQTLSNLRENIVLSAVPDGILVIDAQGRVLMLNPAMEKLSGYRERELLGRCIDLLVPDALRNAHAPGIGQPRASPRARALGEVDIRLHRRDGSHLPVDISIGQMLIDGEPHAIAYVRDLSEMKQARDTLRHSSTHDELTGLPNRWLFSQRLGEALKDAELHQRHVAVMLLDLDNFKAVNDGFGHSTGDALLCQVTERIRESLGIEDFVARLGGDEFAILLKDFTDPAHAEATAARILVALERPYLLKDQEVNSGGSLGIACYPHDAVTNDDLLRCADIAMYRAKHTGRGAYARYAPAMRGEALENLAMHARLKAALREGGLSLHFQPQVSVHSGAIVGAEALLRWIDPKLGSISPAKFIPMAEATGLILPLSDWVLDEACRTMAQWRRVGMLLPLAVNFSAHQFFQPNLFEKVRDALARHGVPPNMLDIEITETAAMDHPENTRSQINALAALGCHVTLDDFGTGYSSLAYLKDFPVSKLKIDKSFMDGIPAGRHDITICKAIMAMARNLNIRLVAEGVEHPEQLQFLRQNGCDMYQGWLFAKAMGSEQLIDLHARQTFSAPETGPSAHAAPPHSATRSHQHIYPQALDLKGAMRRMGNNEAIYRRAIRDFCDSLDLLLPALNDARGGANRQLASLLIHTYKDNAAAVGLHQFAKYMAHLEAALSSENWQYILEFKYNELNTWIQATQRELVQVLTQLATRHSTEQVPSHQGLNVAPSISTL